MNALEQNHESGSAAVMRRWRRGFKALLIGAGLLLYASTALYTVRPDERGVVRLFGKVQPVDSPPGLHVTLPWPMSRVETPRTSEVRRVEVGLLSEDRMLIDDGDLNARAESAKSDVLTGDTNIVKVTLIVQYEVTDPAKYVLAAVDPDEMVKTAALAAMVESVSRQPVDLVMTSGKVQLVETAARRLRERLDVLDTGISLVSVDIHGPTPPNVVMSSFNQVSEELSNKSRNRERANKEANDIRNLASAYYDTAIGDSQAYEARRVGESRGAANAFVALWEEYRKAPDVTRRRLLLDALSTTLPRTRKFVIDDANGTQPINLRMLEFEGPPALE